MLMFALPGLGIPPPPFPSALTLDKPPVMANKPKAPFAFSPLSTHQPLGSSLTKHVHASKPFGAWLVSALPIPSTSQCTRGGQI